MNRQNFNTYKEINRSLWDLRLEEHLRSDFYDLNSFINGKSSLNKIELDLLGDINGKSILHLQCHFGQDSISLGRMGAEVTAIDFSEKSIEKAKSLSKECKINVDFVCCDVFDLPQYLKQKFDIVFTSYGTIIWLPDLNRWSNVIKNFLKPKGKFVFVEFHPTVWMFDDNLKKIIYSYMNTGAIVEKEEGTYANREANISHQSITWNHGIGEVVSCLIESGLTIESLKEYDYSPYSFVKGMEEYQPNKYRISHFENKLPLTYSITTTKRI